MSHAGWLDASHDERAFECRRWEAACLAKASGVWAAARPSRAAFTRRSVAGLTAQLAQCCRLALMGFPQPRQRFSGRDATGSIAVDEMPFASRLCVWVKCVGGKSVPSRLRVVDHNVCATHSTIGATALPQIGVVSDNRMANDPMSRQLPSRCSKNHSRLRGCRVIQSSK